MPKKRTEIPENAKVKEGTEGKYKKFCPRCRKIYFSDARHQKFCSPECQKAAAVRKKEQKKQYDEAAPALRLSARAHALAVSTFDLLVTMGLKKWECEECGNTEVKSLEIHHVNLNWLINTPSNLKCLCNKCHSKAHADLIHELDEKGMVVDEYYEVADSAFLPIARMINKDKG